jgi:enoyl-CoA hydratase/carnithine racemase
VFTYLENYEDKWPNYFKFDRRNGILQLTVHTEGGSMMWSPLPDGPQHIFGEMLHDVGHDPENRIFIMTGTGDAWCPGLDMNRLPGGAGDVTPLWWDYLFRAERDIFTNLLNVPVPVIAAINGPATYHAEIPLLSDVCLCTPETYFADDSHVAAGVVPGDGIQIMWEMLIGPNRSRAFQYLHQKIWADEAKALGVVAEIHPKDKLLPRAWEIAEDLISRCTPVTLRNSRATLTENIRRRIHTEHNGSYALEGLAQVMRPTLTQAPNVEIWPEGHPSHGKMRLGHD